MCTSAAPASSETPAASNAFEPAPITPTTLPRSVSSGIWPVECVQTRVRQRAEHVRDLRAARASVAVREHELARRLDALRAVGLQVQAQQVALRLDFDETRAVANLRVRRLLEPGQVVGPREAWNPVERVERRGAVQRLVPRAEAQRDVAAFRPRRHRLRRAQLMHACDRAPDAGLTGLGAIDHVDLADAFALEARTRSTSRYGRRRRSRRCDLRRRARAPNRRVRVRPSAARGPSAASSSLLASAEAGAVEAPTGSDGVCASTAGAVKPPTASAAAPRKRLRRSIRFRGPSRSSIISVVPWSSRGESATPARASVTRYGLQRRR